MIRQQGFLTLLNLQRGWSSSCGYGFHFGLWRPTPTTMWGPQDRQVDGAHNYSNMDLWWIFMVDTSTSKWIYTPNDWGGPL